MGVSQYSGVFRKVSVIILGLIIITATINGSNILYARKQITAPIIIASNKPLLSNQEANIDSIKQKTNRKYNNHQFSAINKLELEGTPIHGSKEAQNRFTQWLNISVSTTEFSIYKYNGTKNIYVNVTDNFNVLIAANHTIYTNLTDPVVPIPIGGVSVKELLKKRLSSIGTGRWLLQLDYSVLDRAPPGTYNVTFLATKEGYNFASATVIMHLESYDHSPPILTVIEPKPMIDVRPNGNKLNFTFIAKDDFWIKIIDFGGVSIFCNRPDEGSPYSDPNGDILLTVLMPKLQTLRLGLTVKEWLMYL